MRPTSCMSGLGAAHVVVSRIAVALEYALEVAQQPVGPFPFQSLAFALSLDFHPAPGSITLSHPDPEADGFAEQLQHRAESEGPDHSLQAANSSSVCSAPCSAD